MLKLYAMEVVLQINGIIWILIAPKSKYHCNHNKPYLLTRW